MRFKSVIFLFFLIFQGCGRPPVHTQAGLTAMFAHSREMKKQHNWQLFGYGGSFYGGDIKKLDLSFLIHRNTRVEEARNLLILGVKKFIATINDNEELRQHLHHFPLDLHDLIYSITFKEQGRIYVDKDYIAHVLLRNGIIYYTIYNPIADRLEDFYEEPYEEALEKVNNSNPVGVEE